MKFKSLKVLFLTFPQHEGEINWCGAVINHSIYICIRSSCIQGGMETRCQLTIVVLVIHKLHRKFVLSQALVVRSAKTLIENEPIISFIFMFEILILRILHGNLKAFKLILNATWATVKLAIKPLVDRVTSCVACCLLIFPLPKIMSHFLVL